MKIRPMTIDDLSGVSSLGDAFQSALHLNIPVDIPSVSKTMGEWLGKDFAIALVAGEDNGEISGMICALGYPCPWNNKFLIGEELFWWVSPNYRHGSVGLRLFDALVTEAKRRGWNALAMCAATGSDSFGAVSRLYERRGFSVSDHKYWKEF